MGAKWGMVIYNCISAAEILLALVCISRVVYLEPGMSGRRNKILFAVAFLVPTLFVQICPGMSKDIFSAFPVCFFAVYMVIVRREKRIRGIFLTVPVLGFLMGIVSVFYAVPYTLTGKYPSEGGWLYAVDALFWIAVFCCFRNFRRCFFGFTAFSCDSLRIIHHLLDEADHKFPLRQPAVVLPLIFLQIRFEPLEQFLAHLKR